MRKRIGIGLVGILWAASTVSAALAPGTIDKMKKQAPEVVRVEILKAEKGKLDEGLRKRRVIYTARILEVERSGLKLKAGQSVKIHSYVLSLPLGVLPVPGPRAPSLHSKGWKGRIYCRPAKDGKNLAIAVYGHSFEKDPEKKK